jgi:hypothetical protein
MIDATAAPGRARLRDVVPKLDGWRQPPVGRASAGGAYKEWMHFCVRLPGDPVGHLLVNLNVTEATSAGATVRTPRLIALAHQRGWTGTLDGFADADVHGEPGGLDLRLGPNELTWRGDAFHLVLRTTELAADLTLRPLSFPTISSSISFGPGHSLHWVVIPRLAAHGWVEVGGRRLALQGAPAYHDHNWGHFRWGGDLAWEWGFVHAADPASPWSVVFVRVSDGGRHRTLSQGALVWRGEALMRIFQDREVQMDLVGAHEGGRPFTIPPLAALLLPGTSSGVPAQLQLRAEGMEDHLHLDFASIDKARVVMPSDVDPLRLVVLNETCGEARAHGRVRGESFDLLGPALLELVGG